MVDVMNIFSKLSKTSRRVLYIVIACIASGLIFLIFFGGNKEKIEFLTAEVKYGDVQDTVLATGKLQAFKQVDVGAQASGQISKLLVEIGDEVKEGDVIAQIDPRTQNNQLQVAQASLANDRALLLSRQATFTQAQQELARQKAMYEQGATSKEALQSAQANYKTAQAAVTQAKSQIEQSQINVETAKLNLGYTTLTAPMDSTVIAVPVEEGQTLNAGLNTPTVVTLAQLDKMTIKAEIAEADVSRVKPEMKAQFTLMGNNEKHYQAVLRSIDPGPTSVSDNGSSSTSDTAIYYYGLLDVPNEDGILRIDMTANIEIIIDEKKHVLLAPSAAVKNIKGKSTIDILNAAGQPESREVKTGLSDGVNTEIISGVAEGDEIIIGQGERKTPGGDMPRVPRR